MVTEVERLLAAHLPLLPRTVTKPMNVVDQPVVEHRVAKKYRDLFEPITEPAKRHVLFERARTASGAEPGRIMANEVFATFADVDGNFVEQFQTSGFDARIYELYFHAYLARNHFVIDRSFARPDFIIDGPKGRAAVEVTTSIRERSFDFEKALRDLKSFTPEALRQRMDHEIPIRLGGPLYDKLKKRYWELPQCNGIPLVLAIEPFFDTTALSDTSAALSDYLYAVRHQATRDGDGNLVITSTPIESHVLGPKTIPSGFFFQPDAENISAVIFSNSGTWPKFNRMGFQAGFHRGNVTMFRHGFRNDPDPRASEPTKFFYVVGDGSHDEEWSEGLEVFHNPRARIALPREYFPGAADHVLHDGVLATLSPPFHPFASETITLGVRGFEFTRERDGVTVDSIMRREFDELVLRRQELLPVLREREWLADRHRRMLAVVIEDEVDHDWSIVVVSPRGGTEAMRSGFTTDNEARSAAVCALVEALRVTDSA